MKYYVIAQILTGCKGSSIISIINNGGLFQHIMIQPKTDRSNKFQMTNIKVDKGYMYINQSFLSHFKEMRTFSNTYLV